MPEKFEESLRKGYRTWRKNMKVGVPQAINAAIQLIISMVFIILFALAFFFFFTSLTESYDDHLVYDPFSMYGFLSILVLSVLFFIFSLVFVDSFFTAGAIGMSKEAIEKGTTKLNDMISYGKRNVVSVFLAKILVIALVYILPIILISVLVSLPLLSNMFNVSLFLAFTLLGVFIVYSFVMDIVFYPVSYAIVVKDYGAFDGVRMGYRFALDNKLAVVLMWITVGGINTVYNLFVGLIVSLFNIIGIIPYIGTFIALTLAAVIGLFSMLVSALLIGGLTAVLWTRLYLKRI